MKSVNAMISVEKAKQLVNENSFLLEPTTIQLVESVGYVLAEDILAPISLPPFNQSAMDGYAIGGILEDSKTYKLVGEIKAGDIGVLPLNKDEAIRIFTGALVPKSAECVIMQEVTTVINGKVTINSEIKSGSNIRLEGEQIKTGDVALPKGTPLTPAGVGFLSGLGISEVKVYAKPKIGLIITGSELVEAGKQLKSGQIYESNSATLKAALASTNFECKATIVVEDTLKSTIIAIEKMMNSMDVVILSGGISVGDYDFVGKALNDLAVKPVFYKVKQKPGKPVFFGKKNKHLFFALPGNPSAALLCYYQYVLLAARKMSGIQNNELKIEKLESVNEYVKKGERAHFLKAIAENGKVEILTGQSSAMLHTYSIANALAYIPADVNKVEKGALIEVYLLP